MAYFVKLFYLVTYLVSINCANLKYSDLVAVNASCGTKDTCGSVRNSKFRVSLNWRERNCFCDNLCNQYGDCCIDASSYDAKSQQKAQKRDKCVILRNYGGIYLRKSCSPDWTGSAEVRTQCLAADYGEGAPRPDPLLALPVTSRASDVTYANYFCALCSHDADDIEMWVQRVECPTLAGDENVTQTELGNKLNYVDSTWSVEAEGVRHKCSIDPYMPETVADKVRLCKDGVIDFCPASYANETVAELCDSYTAIVYGLTSVYSYRNYHCALCNGVSADELSCFTTELRTRGNFNGLNYPFESSSFALLFDFYDPAEQTGAVGFRCDAGEIWDPFFLKCRRVICRAGAAEEDCSLQETATETTQATTSFSRVSLQHEESNGTHRSQHIILLPDEVPSTTPSEAQFDENRAFLNCNKILLPHDEYEVDENGLVIIAKYQMQLNESEYENSDLGILICVFETVDEKFSPLMGLVSVSGLGISILCLVFHLVAFCFVPDLRNLSGKNLACLCLSLLAAYCSFIIGIFGEEGSTECVALASMTYYFFMASFCWMNVMALDVWRTLQQATRDLRVSGGGQWLKFTLYSAYSWGVPAAAVALVVALDATTPAAIPQEYLPELGVRLCWFGQRQALLLFFGLPLFVVMAVNLVCFALTAVMIAQASSTTKKICSSQQHQSRLVLYTRLALLMGLGWLSGLVAGYARLPLLWYAFILLNTLQGLFIFISFTCKRKVLEAFCCSKSLPMYDYRPRSSGPHNTDSGNSHCLSSSDANVPCTDSSNVSL